MSNQSTKKTVPLKIHEDTESLRSEHEHLPAITVPHNKLSETKRFL